MTDVRGEGEGVGLTVGASDRRVGAAEGKVVASMGLDVGRCGDGDGGSAPAVGLKEGRAVVPAIHR